MLMVIFRVVLVYLLIGCGVALVVHLVTKFMEDNIVHNYVSNGAGLYLMVLSIVLWPACVFAIIKGILSKDDAPSIGELDDVVDDFNNLFKD